jgi:hypothetical protein
MVSYYEHYEMIGMGFGALTIVLFSFGVGDLVSSIVKFTLIGIFLAVFLFFYFLRRRQRF